MFFLLFFFQRNVIHHIFGKVQILCGLADGILPADTLLQQDGRRVLALRAIPQKVRCRRIWKLTESGVEAVENDA